MKDKELTSYEEMEREDARGLRQEELIVEVTEALARALRTSGLTQAEIANRLGKTKGFVSQIMGGGNNLTLRTLADVAGAIGCRAQVNLVHEAKGKVSRIDDWNKRPAREAEALDLPHEADLLQALVG
jgi:transcriptional regulator with XRE-family HTH domain